MKAPDPLPNKEVSFTGNHDPDLQKNKKKGFRKKEISQQGNQQDLSEILFLLACPCASGQRSSFRMKQDCL